MLESRVLQVFYDNLCYPFKDSERTVRYPIVGNSFAGSNLTNEIHFYIDRIGGTNGISWVIVSKLPNGKIGYEPLSLVGIDSDNGESYLTFKLSSYYTSVKGDLYLALRGYQGDITFTDTNDDGIYEINGDPLIEVTGTIKLAINYSPMINTGTQVLPSDVDKLIAALSNYSLRANTMEFVRYNAGGKTIAQLVTSLGDTSNIVHSFWLEGIDQPARYIGAVFKVTRNGQTVYDLELERVGSGIASAQDRWVARSLTGTELINDILNRTNKYYKPYLVSGTEIDYDNATYADLISIAGSVPIVIRLVSQDSANDHYGGYYLFKNNADTNRFLAIRLTPSGSSNFGYRYEGIVSDTSTPIKNIFNFESSYYKPYLVQVDNTVKIGFGSIIYQEDEIKIINDNGAGIIVQDDYLSDEIGRPYVLKEYVDDNFFKQGTNDLELGSGHILYQNDDSIKIANDGNYGIVITPYGELVNIDGRPYATNLYVDNKVSQAIIELGSVLIYKGTKTVAEINALTSGQRKTGDVYNVSDGGTLTIGSVVVIAGDNVAWTGSTWDKLAGTLATDNFVTLDGSQRITGTKTFENHQTFEDLVTFEDKIANYGGIVFLYSASGGGTNGTLYAQGTSSRLSFVDTGENDHVLLYDTDFMNNTTDLDYVMGE